MRILPAHAAGIREALAVLEDGGVVAHATETCYGLACNLTDADAVRRMFSVKRRPEAQPVSALFPSVAATDAWVTWNGAARSVAERELPGPVTLILLVRQDRIGMIFPTPAGGATLGIRVSPHPVAKALAEGFRRPISTTSANVHGLPNPYRIETMLEQFADGPAPDLILDSGALPERPPSTVLDFSDGSGKALREGGSTLLPGRYVTP